MPLVHSFFNKIARLLSCEKARKREELQANKHRKEWIHTQNIPTRYYHLYKLDLDT